MIEFKAYPKTPRLDAILNNGEWFGEGIQKNPLGITGKRFALFNTFRDPSTLPDCVENVPILFSGSFEGFQIAKIISDLEQFGSSVKGAAAGAKPEGFIVYFHGFRQRAKWTFEHQKGKWNTQ